MPFRLELLGNGPDRSWITREFAGNPSVVIHGEKSGPDYWRIMSHWDFILFVSDTEGTPLALLEAMACGVLPLYPRIGSGGDEYVEHVSKSLLFELDKLDQVAAILNQIRKMPHDDVTRLRTRCRDLLSVNLGNGYLKMFHEFMTHILSMPRISSSLKRPRRIFLTDFVPFGVIRRYMPRSIYKR
jgi:glycosyltransferase involved in cell wall biosynthesis